jgi:hypothetical protein
MGEVSALRTEKDDQRGGEMVYKGDQFIGWLRKHAGPPGRDPVYRGVTAGSAVAGESECRDEALEMLEEAWEEEREAQLRS